MIRAVVVGALLIASVASADPGLTETARVLAGKSVASSPDYAARIASSWAQFQQGNLEHLRTWWAGRAPTTYTTVFYPFGGPDLGNALALFPDADTYLLFGLEAPGAIPELTKLDGAALDAGLSELEASLSTFFQVNYFFTRAMEKKLGKGAFTSISGLLLFFLAINDCEVTSARTIASGVEIAFRRGGGKPQLVRYVMANVSDAALAKSSFLSYLEHQGRFVTMIKSASYLMHKEGVAEPVHFEKIRALILAHSDFIVQDDSGVPLRLFARDTWKLRFHGAYEAPTPEFSKYRQRDLEVEMQRNSTGPLPFSYGYAFAQGASNLVTAERMP